MEFTKVIIFCLISYSPTSYCYYLGTIACVRWSPNGDMLASASYDQTVHLLDFKTGTQLYTGETSDGGKF